MARRNAEERKHEELAIGAMRSMRNHISIAEHTVKVDPTEAFEAILQAKFHHGRLRAHAMLSPEPSELLREERAALDRLQAVILQLPAPLSSAVSNPKQKPWTNYGGGCLLATDVEYPCDDHYYRPMKGKLHFEEEADFVTTAEAHFSMPAKASRLSELTRRSGVKLTGRQERDTRTGEVVRLKNVLLRR